MSELEKIVIRGRLSEIWRPVLVDGTYCFGFLAVIILPSSGSFRDVLVFGVLLSALLLTLTLPAWILAGLTSYEVDEKNFVVRRCGRIKFSVPCDEVRAFEIDGQARWVDLAWPFVHSDGIFPRARTRSPRPVLHCPILIWANVDEVEQKLANAVQVRS